MARAIGPDAVAAGLMFLLWSCDTCLPFLFSLGSCPSWAGHRFQKAKERNKNDIVGIDIFILRAGLPSKGFLGCWLKHYYSLPLRPVQTSSYSTYPCFNPTNFHRGLFSSADATSIPPCVFVFVFFCSGKKESGVLPSKDWGARPWGTTNGVW